MNLSLGKCFNFGILVIVSIYYSFNRFTLQTAIDGGLVLSGLIDFPENIVNVKYFFFNIWSFLHHFIFVLLKFNFSVDAVSHLLIFTTTFFHMLGIYLLSTGFGLQNFLALIISLFSIIMRINFGSVDYPVLIFSEHTYGAFSLSCFTLICGLVSNKNFKSAGFFSLLLIGCHIVVGLWSFFLVISSFLFSSILFNQKNKDRFKQFIYGSFFMLPALIISLLIFKYNMMESPSYKLEDFNIYLKEWDHHRNIVEIHFKYIIKTSLLLLFIIFYLSYSKINKNQIFNIFVFFSCVGSLIIYLIYKFFYNYLPDFIIMVMPTRLFLLHTLIGFPVIFCILFNLCKNITPKVLIKLKFKSFFYSSFCLLVIFLLVLNFKKIENKYLKIKNEYISLKNNDTRVFWQTINKLKTDGYFVTGEFSSGPLLKYAKKPYLINAFYIDTISYAPSTSSEIRLIIEDVYGVSFENPPKKHLAMLVDAWYKKNFEERSYNEWLELSKKYNISGVIVPSGWNLNLNDKIVSKKFIAYLINKN